MSRCAIKIEVVLLYVFAVIAFAVRQPEKAFFQDRIFAVPQAQSKAEILLVVGNSREAIFSPAVRPRPGLIVSEIVPSIAILAVIFSNRAPLSFTQVRSPFSPWHTLYACLLNAHCL